MNIVLLGKPGAGKGTMCQMLKEQGYTILPTGDLLREEIKKGTALGKEIDGLFKEGKMAPVHLTNQLVKDFLDIHKSENIVLDAYPRNQAQYEASKGFFDKLIVLDCPDEIVKDRLIYREVHMPSGRVYNKKYHPSQNIGLDDVTGEVLTQRVDDQPEIIEKRLNVFYQETYPVIESLKSELSHLVLSTDKLSIDEQIGMINNFIQQKKFKIR